MGKNGIPDRWLDYSNFGDVIEGTRIVALKVPLKEVLLNKVQQKERFSPQMATDGIPKLDYVIDLTYTKRYYSPHEFQSRGIGHSKIATEGHVIPNGAVMRRFFDTMDSYLADDRRTGVIGVHCTHGVNRTGYMVCRYMISKLGFAPDQAIAAFNKARGHDLERANYLMDLRAGNWPELPEAVPEEPPEPAVESDRRREPWTPADQRRQRREERRRGAAPFPWPPPAGHRWNRPPGPPRFWRPPPPWAGPDWRPRGPPPPCMWPGGGEGWRHGPPPPRPPPHDDGPSREARDGPPQDTGDQWQPEPRPVAADDPPPSAERPPPSADRGHDRPVPTGTRVLSITPERCPLVVETGAPPEVIVLSDSEPSGDVPKATTDKRDQRVASVGIKDRISPVSAGAKREISPVSGGAKGKISPVSAGAKGKISPASTGAKEKISPVSAGPKGKTSPVPMGAKGGISPVGPSGDTNRTVAAGREAREAHISPGAARSRIPSGEKGGPAADRPSAPSEPVRRGFRQRAADAGWSWGGRR